MLPALLSVAEADRILAGFSGSPESSHASWPPESVPLDAAVGRVLREDVCADRAYPAQDRSRMDGIGILHVDWEQGTRAFVIAGLVRAGDPRTVLSRNAQIQQDAGSFLPCMEIMTGAPVPEGVDTVIPYEDVAIEDGVARVRDEAAVRHRQFVHARGSDCARGDVLVPAGVRLQAAHIAVAASVGMARLRVARRPRVAVVATGDELVGVHESPLEHQLRVSNAHGLAALFAPWAETSVRRCGDDPAALSALLKAALAECDLLLVSGGVSAGKFDAVPATLETLGVQKVFHKLAQKPGKPLWFGVSGPVAVFGLPGNPVSSLVCARRFVLPLLWARLGWTAAPASSIALASPVEKASGLTQYLPVRVEKRDGLGHVAESHAINGSGDFAALGGSDGFVELSPDQNHYPAGAIMAFFPWSP